jgi:hypothetical protein
MKSFIIFFVYIVITFIILSSLGPTKAGIGYYGAFSTVYVAILAIIIGCMEEDNEE